MDDEEYVRSFRMFDRWATDILPLAGEYFRQTTKKLMWENQLLHGTLEVDGRRGMTIRARVPLAGLDPAPLPKPETEVAS